MKKLITILVLLITSFFLSSTTTFAISKNHTDGGGSWYLGQDVTNCSIEWFTAPITVNIPTNIDSGDTSVDLQLVLTDLTEGTGTTFNSVEVNDTWYTINLSSFNPEFTLSVPVGDTTYTSHVNLNIGKITYTGCNSGMSVSDYSQNTYSIIVDDYTPIDNSAPQYVDIPREIYSNVSNPYSLEYILSNVAVFDDVDGDLTSEIRVILDEYSSNMHTIGIYHITLTVADSDGNVSNLLLKVQVLDVDAPVMEGITDLAVDIGTETVNYLHDITVTDNYDDVSVENIIVDDSLVDLTTYGDYIVTYYIEDSSGNYSFEEISLRVKDITNPVIEGITSIVKRPEDVFLLDEIVNEITAYDNLMGDITDLIEISVDEYTGFGDTIGSYNVTFSVTDNFDNTTTHTIVVHVSNTIPVGTKMIDFEQIHVPNDYVLTDNDYLTILKYAEEVDPTKDYAITLINNEYTGNEQNVGTYDVTVKIISNSGIFYQKDIEIVVFPNVDYDLIEGESASIGFWNEEYLSDVPNWITVPSGIIIICFLFVAYKKL